MGFILFFIIRYANTKAEESNKNEIAAYEKMTMTTSQIIVNYLEDEQHLCDIWANYTGFRPNVPLGMQTRLCMLFFCAMFGKPQIFSCSKPPQAEPGSKFQNAYDILYSKLMFPDDSKFFTGISFVRIA